ncbi:MAG: efflux RND transporter periplasmic adaptor subunit [Verrucomicrobia bacterium]|nr:efflux RND transporter periplasmic adaptor subunit [Verrucomicrobiota bacterium]
MATLLTDYVERATAPIRKAAPAKRSVAKYRWVLGAGILALVALLFGWFGRTKPDVGGATFVVRRGPLPIIVTEGGSIEARESQEIRSEIKGYQGTKILSIVEEGYLVTEEDVKNGKVLVELDSSEIKQRIVTHDSQFQSTRASYIDAQQSYGIQINQSQSDIKAAEQKVRFARMDLEKYLGDRVTKEILDKTGLGKEPSETSTNATEKLLSGLMVLPPSSQTQFAALVSARPEIFADAKAPATISTNGAPGGIEAPKPLNLDPFEDGAEDLEFLRRTNSIVIDFSQYAKTNLLGDGEAQQKLRKSEDDLLVGQSELKMAQTKFEGSQRLLDRGFLTKTEYDNDKLNVDKGNLKVKTAQTALDLFIKYEFTKAAEEFLAKYDEAIQALIRAKKEAISKLAQARAKWRGVEGRYRIEEAQQKELYDQWGKCVIRAQRPGLVVYGGGGDRRFWSGEDQIREGATVRERQPIITIPDMTEMSVRVKIHEAQIKKIQKGMKARIRIDAFADKELAGDVAKVGVLPDSQDRWMNPDLKVYLTTIDIEGVHDWLKPGMSAKVEVLVNQLDDVVYVPIQAVVPSAGKHLCYVQNGGEPETREVKIGEFNDEFIEIKEGLKEGERVLLRAPQAPEIENEVNGQTPEPDTEPGPSKRDANDQKPAVKPSHEDPLKPSPPTAPPAVKRVSSNNSAEPLLFGALPPHPDPLPEGEGMAVPAVGECGSLRFDPHAANDALAPKGCDRLGVAQIFNLPYRRIAFCGGADLPACRNHRRHADCKSAIQQTTSPRFEEGRIAAGESKAIRLG